MPDEDSEATGWPERRVPERHDVGRQVGARSPFKAASDVTRRVGGARDLVVVVGAGIAGLVAAYELRKQGVPVVVLESASRAGDGPGATSSRSPAAGWSTTTEPRWCRRATTRWFRSSKSWD